jgi:hypothetical protein
MGILAFIVVVDVIVGNDSDSKAVGGLKVALFLALIAIFGKMLLKAPAKVEAIDGIKNYFEAKAVTCIMATPDEISQALTDPSQRTLWDSQVASVKKEGDSLSITYTSNDSQTLSEASKIDMYLDKAANSTHFI